MTTRDRTGIIRRNPEKLGENWPDYTGYFDLDGIRHSFVVWDRKGADGKWWGSIKIKGWRNLNVSKEKQ